MYIYFHLCTIENWEEIVTKLFAKLQTSGLLDVCVELRVIVLGNHLERAKQLLKHPKTKIIIHSTDVNLYERPALYHIQKSAEGEDFKVLYFHSKGISKKNLRFRSYINDWVDMMCYFLIDGHKECIRLLSTAGAVGVNYMRAGEPLLRKNATNRTVENSHHFSGNFWWSCSRYLRTLPTTIGPKYLDPELWIGSGTGELHSVYQSRCRHYFQNYPPDRYVGKQKYTIIKVNKNTKPLQVKPATVQRRAPHTLPEPLQVKLDTAQKIPEKKTTKPLQVKPATAQRRILQRKTLRISLENNHTPKPLQIKPSTDQRRTPQRRIVQRRAAENCRELSNMVSK